MADEPKLTRPYVYQTEEGDFCMEFMMPDARAMIHLGKENDGTPYCAWHMITKDGSVSRMGSEKDFDPDAFAAFVQEQPK